MVIKNTFLLTITSLKMIGYLGQISIGHAAFMSIGAYVSAISVVKYSLPIPIGIFLAVFFSFILGLILGFSTLRLKAFYLAIATMGFGVAIEQIVGAWENMTGGHTGIRNIPFYKFFNDDILKYYFVLLFLVISYYIFNSLINGKYGRAWKTIRENEKAVAVIGINVSKFKVIGLLLVLLLLDYLELCMLML